MFLIELAVTMLYKHISSSTFRRGLHISLCQYKMHQGDDPTQLKLLEEQCILIDRNDKAIGSATKRDCHDRSNVAKGMLHRAFSVFLFNEQNELLLQKRSQFKLTYANLWSNSCCSHPLYVSEERDENDHIGARRAAQRRLTIELGIPQAQMPLDAINFVARFYYLFPNSSELDPRWAEHEITYALLARRSVTVVPNSNEVAEVRYVSPEQLAEELRTQPHMFTPWFRAIAPKHLFRWWRSLDNLDAVVQRDVIEDVSGN